MVFVTRARVRVGMVVSLWVPVRVCVCARESVRVRKEMVMFDLFLKECARA